MAELTLLTQLKGPKGDKGDQGVGWNATVLGTADLNTIQTGGVYAQHIAGNNTAGRNYPPTSPTTTGVLEVTTLDNGGVLQRFTVQGGNATAARGFYSRRFNSGTWDSWRFIPSQRIDTTAGRAIYTWDDVAGTERLIEGDTGARAITDLAPNVTAANVLLRRINSEVILTLDGMQLSAGTGEVACVPIPTGFRPRATLESRGIVFTSANPIQPMRTSYASNNFTIVNAVLSTNIHGNLRWRTNEPWPTSLPGTAA